MLKWLLIDWLCALILAGLMFLLSEGSENKIIIKLRKIIIVAVAIVVLIGSFSFIKFAIGLLEWIASHFV